MNEIRVALTELPRRLMSEPENRDVPGVLLFAEESVSYQTLFMVLDQITLAGIHDISLQAKLKQ